MDGWADVARRAGGVAVPLTRGANLWNNGDITGSFMELEIDLVSFFDVQLYVSLLHLLPSKAKLRPDV